MSDLFGTDGSINRSYRPDYSACVLPYCQWFQGDFLGGVRGMTAAEIGVYAMLLNEMYERGTALSQSHAVLARLCGIPVPGFKRTLDMLIAAGKIIVLDAGLWNARVEKSFTTRKIQRDANSWAGRQSGKKRNENNGGDERAFSERSTGAEPSSEVHKEKSSVAKATGAEAPIDPVKAMFDGGVALLGAAGIRESSARQIIGKWRKSHGAEAIIVALGRAQREGAIDPVGFIEGVLKSGGANSRDSPRIGDRKTLPDGTVKEFAGFDGWMTVRQ